eukprot:3685078-Pyramimonas_sp.AAC.1
MELGAQAMVTVVLHAISERRTTVVLHAIGERRTTLHAIGERRVTAVRAPAPADDAADSPAAEVAVRRSR